MAYEEEQQCNGEITLLISDEGANIEIYDRLSRVCIVKATLGTKQICQALGRLAHTKCVIQTGCLDHIGKKMEVKGFDFPIEIPPEYKHDRNKKKEIAKETALKLCPEGWEPDNYYGSQNSFYRDREGKEYASTFIRRWVNPSDSENNS